MFNGKDCPALIEDARHDAQSIVNAASDLFGKAGHHVIPATPEGFPKKVITDYAKKCRFYGGITRKQHGHKILARRRCTISASHVR
jgi:hypothetical protein